jgi:MSHA biogenesis protein MshO
MRYRDDPPGSTDQRLAVGAADASFSTLGAFTRLPSRPFASSSHFLSVYNLGQSGADAYTGANVITAAGASIAIDSDPLDASSDRITLGTATSYSLASPGQRAYLTETPVSFICDTAAGTLRRYRNYTLSSTQSATHAALLAAGASYALLADHVSTCAFAYSAGGPTRAALATLTLTLSDSGENVRLIVQAHVVNVP